MDIYDKIHENEELKTYILAGNRVLGELGFTEHGLAHAGTVSKMSREILEILNYSDHECELAAVAGYMHDIGNMINRCDHAQSGGSGRLFRGEHRIFDFRYVPRSHGEHLVRADGAGGAHDF